VLPPGGPAVSGRDGIRQFWQGAMGMGVREVELRTEHAEAAGDLAYEIGSATLLMRPEGGAETTDTVKYVVVWKRREGDPWQLVVDIWNGNISA
jgi:ketosteroid isomerase-like protein